MADIVINPAIGKIDFFSVKGDNVTNTLKLTGNTLLVTGPLSASSISTGGGGAFVTSVQPTSNYLSKFTGNSTIANSLIYDNGTNVGIGTTTSAARLQINSTTSGATLLRTDGTSGTLFTVVDDLSDSLMSVNNSAGLPVLEVFADDRIVGGQYGTNDFVVINNKVGIGTNNPTAKLQVTSSVSTPSATFLGGNVGIGTTNPTQKLEVAGYAMAGEGVYRTSIYGSNSGAWIGFGDTSNTVSIGRIGAYGALFNINSINGDTSFQYNGSEKMRITTGGNVGIATSSPTAKLQVGTQMYGSAPDANYFVVGNENFSGPGPVGGISGYPTTANRNQVTASMFDVAGGWERGNGSHALLRVSAYDVINSTPALTVLNNGNVGMGTTTPISLLDVRSGYITAGSSASTNGSTILAGYYSNSAGILTVLGTEFSSGGPVLGYAVTPSTSGTGAFLSSTTITIPRSAYTQDGGTHRWFTGAAQSVAIGSAVTTSEKMRINSDGNLGIGTTSPAYKLDVNGSISLSGYRFADFNTYYNRIFEPAGNTAIWLGNASDPTNYSDNTNHAFRNRGGSSIYAYISSNGNLGIGTTSPNDKLTILADNYLSFQTSNVTFNSGRGARIGATSTGSGIGELIFETYKGGSGGGERMRITSDGCVGIGTTSPATKLDVRGNLFVANAATGNNIIAFGNIGALGPLNGAPNNLTGSAFLVVSSSTASGAPSHMKFFTTTGGACGERIRIAADGNVGIGTTSPATKLHVYDSATGYRAIRVQSGAGDAGVELIGQGGNIFSIQQPNAAAGLFFYDRTNSSERMRIASDGNVGINQSSPAYKLDVNGNGRFANDLYTNGSLVIARAGAYLYINGTNSDSEIVWQANGSNRWAAGMNVGDATENFNIYNYTTATTNFTILKANGNVGIGSTAPNDKLDVVGRVYAYRYIAVSSNASLPAYATDTSTGMYNAATNQIGFSISGTEKLRIDTAGNLGIGTSSPIGKLQVGSATFNGGNGVYTNDRIGVMLNGSLTSYVYASTYNDPTYPDYGFVFIHGTNTSNYNVWSISPDGPAKGSGLHFIYGANATNIHNTTPKISFIGSSGNVGIGTTSPISKLNAYASGSNKSVLKIDGGNGTLFEVTDQLSGSLFSVNTIAGLPVMEAFSNNRVVMGKYNANDFVISGSKIGIGTSSPVAKLSVYATSPHASPTGISVAAGAGGANLLARDSSNCHNWFPYTDGFNYYSADSHIFRSSNLLTNYVYINSSGNVGIGTSSPASKLHIDDATAPWITISRSGTPTWQLRNNFPSNQYGFSFNNTTAGTVPLFIGAGGNIGIGLDSPGAKLDIASTQANGIVMRFDTSTNYNAWIRPYWNSNTDTRIDFAINRSSGVTPDVIMSVGYGTNVGIGTTAPVAKLHTVTTTAGSTVIRADGTSGTLFSVVDDLSDSLMSVNNSAGLPVLEVFADDRIVGGQYGVNDFVVINNKVGIGTNNPLGKLHVSGSNATSIIDGLSIGRGPGNIITNTIVGNGALLSNTTGVSNVAVGYRALNANTSGDRNTAVGRDALYINTSGYANNAFGRESLRSNTIGAGNSAFGDRALYSNTIGNNNSAFGAGSLYLNTTGTFNVAFGTYALRNNTIGISNSAFGYYALRGNSTGRFNTAVGRDALRNNSSGENNTAVGINALTNNTFGTYNTAVGGASLSSNTTGNRNSAFGTSALFSNTFGSGSAAFGHFALRNNTTGNYNVAMGALALRANTTGVGNSAFGVRALSTNPGFDGSFSSAFGYKALRYTFFGNKLSAFGAYALENNGTGVQNCAFGYKSLQANGGSRNNAFGYKSLVINTIGSNNNAFGYLSLASNTIGNNNNAFGRSALSANTTGNTNDAFGNYALRFNTTGQKNVAMGYQSLYTNTIGIRNNAFGYKALYSNSIGNANTAFGYLSLQNNNTSANTAFGSYALQANTTGWANVACGHRALTSNTTGSRNNAFGFYALTSNNSGYFNSAFGERSLRLTTSGAKNSAFGFYAIADNVVGVGNQAFGYRALKFNTTSYNHAFGNQALFNNTIGNANSAFGNYSLYTNTTGANNTAFGYRTLYSNSTGKNNSAFGYKAGEAVTTGTNLTIIGASAAASSATATNEITLGNSSVATLRCQVTTITALSDFRDKTDINDIQLGLSFVEKLRPVTFKWDRREWYTDGNRDGSKKDSVIQAGFIAQELKALQEEEGVEFLKLVYESNPDKLEATPGNLMIPLIKAVQELSAKVKTLEAKVQILESK